MPACHLILVSFLFFITRLPAALILVPQQQPTIQAGIDAATDGDTVLVDHGTYTENINFRGKAITVASRYIQEADSNHISSTVIDGSQPADPDSGSVVYFISGGDTSSVLIGFTITGGSGTFLWDEGPIRVGGGIFFGNSGGRIGSNIIENNRCIINVMNGVSIGGGISAGAPGSQVFVIIEDNIIQNNTVYAPRAATGAGLSLLANGRIEGNRVLFNESSADSTYSRGAGIYINDWVNYTNHVILKGNVVEYNKLSGNGNDCEGSGGGVLFRCNGLVLNNRIAHNKIKTGWGAAAGLWLGTPGTLHCANNVISDNDIEATYRSFGGGVILKGSDRLPGHMIFSENQVINNRANSSAWNDLSYSGGIYIENCSPELYNNLIQGNVSNGLAGGINVSWWPDAGGIRPEPVLINNTIVENQSSRAETLYLYDSRAIILNSILWNPVNDYLIYLTGNSSIQVERSIVSDEAYVNLEKGCFSMDPQFAGDDYSLKQNSPAIGLGRCTFRINDKVYQAPLYDIERNLRPAGVDSLPDLGARESPYAAVPQPVHTCINHDCSYIDPLQDPVTVNLQMLNIHQNDIRVSASLKTGEGTVWDIIELYDDGQHVDGGAGDNLYGNSLDPVQLEKEFRLDYSILNKDNQQEYTFADNKQFTSIGPVSYHSHRKISQSDQTIELELILQNEGNQATAAEVKALLIAKDSSVTEIRHNNQSFGDIKAGVTATSLGSYIIKGEDLSEVLPFEIQIFAHNYHYWTYTPLVVGIEKATSEIPQQFALHQNYPNPFNPLTVISWQLPVAIPVNLSIYNTVGHRVAVLVKERLPAGFHSVEFNASRLASGVYFFRLEAGHYIETRKMILLQ